MGKRLTGSLGRSWAHDKRPQTGMNQHALEVLEFERVLDKVAQRASSEPGRKSLLERFPGTDRDGIVSELGQVEATARFLEERPDWDLGPIPDVRDKLDQLSTEGAVLDASGLHQIRLLICTSRLLSVELRSVEEPMLELVTIAGKLIELGSLEETIGRSVDEKGMVLNSASRDLNRIRESLKGAHSGVVRKLEGHLARLPERFVVPDASVTIREGRYVIPLRREGRREVGGIVHGESQTGATLYVEPPLAIELMNRVRDLEGEEAREILRILGALTELLARESDKIYGAFEALIEFDTLYARAKVARSWGGVAPELLREGERGFEIREGRHPLVLESGETPVVPFDLKMAPDERALVVSGPNTGGKSVLLKGIGLIAALAQSGIIPPVGPGTRVPIFRSFFADIGDEQSIAHSLSTFSAHLVNLRDIVACADEFSLVLIDEMGTGTDPAEGAALARSILEDLVSRGSLAIISSHLGELKELDQEGSGVVNASLQFDSDRMRPTYHLVKGRPGRSYGLAIARRLKFPSRILDRAEMHRDDGAVRIEELLTRLERQEEEVSQLAHKLVIEKDRATRLKSDLDARESALQEAERSAEEQTREKARKLLLKAREEVEAAILELRGAAKRGETLEDASRVARRRVEYAVSQQRSSIPEERRDGEPTNVTLGDQVTIRSLGSQGTVIDIRGGRALVEVGSLRLEVTLTDLDFAGLVPEEQGTVYPLDGWSANQDSNLSLEVDLRGLRVDEMERELTHALDEAVVGDLAELRIIHGKGTGALRKRVGEMLEQDLRVQGFRMGSINEGGAGVTVASFG